MPRQHAFDRRLTEEPHALLSGCLLDLGRRLARENHLANAVAQIEQLANRHAALVAGAAALDAPKPFVERGRPIDHPFEPGLLEELARHLCGPLAVMADRPDETLGQ